METIKDIKHLKTIINEANSIVFLGGAGTSTESGIPDFRSENGLYHQPHQYSPEKILSHNFFFHQPKIFYEFYHTNIINHNPSPNSGHYVLKRMEEKGQLKAIITQNIDGLHQAAGSKNVIELHGSIHRNHCVKCNQFYDLNYIKQHQGTIRCENCGGLIKPDVVLYQEPLNEKTLLEAVSLIESCDLLIIAGTSLNVYPAAGLLRYAKKTLLINLTRTSKDIVCDYVYYGRFGETFAKLYSTID